VKQTAGAIEGAAASHGDRAVAVGVRAVQRYRDAAGYPGVIVPIGRRRSFSGLLHTLKSSLAPQWSSFLGNGARGFGGRHAPTMSPRQLKEVIQVTHINVGSIASLGALVGGEAHR
jgi:hypothetical protein